MSFAIGNGVPIFATLRNGRANKKESKERIRHSLHLKANCCNSFNILWALLGAPIQRMLEQEKKKEKFNQRFLDGARVCAPAPTLRHPRQQKGKKKRKHKSYHGGSESFIFFCGSERQRLVLARPVKDTWSTGVCAERESQQGAHSCSSQTLATAQVPASLQCKTGPTYLQSLDKTYPQDSYSSVYPFSQFEKRKGVMRAWHDRAWSTKRETAHYLSTIANTKKT